MTRRSSPPVAARGEVAAPPTSPWLAKHGALAVLLGVILLIALVRVRVADVPLERDEGEYAYAGQLILHGIPPYQQAYNMKFPGTYYAYSLILAIFGSTPRGIHTGLLFVNAATTLLVFAIGRRLAGSLFAAIAAVTFALLSADPFIMGVFAHATHFALLPVLGGLLTLTLTPRSLWHLLGSGALLGLAVLMKQHAVFFLPLGAVFIVWQARSEGALGRRKLGSEVGALALGAALPFAAMCALFFVQGVLGKFWFWTFRYARAYVSEVPASQAPGILVDTLSDITSKTLPLWLLSGAGLVLLWTTGWNTRVRVFVTGVLLASFLSVCPGFYFRQHYFILLLPAVGLLAGIAVVSLARFLERVVSPAAACALAVAVFAVAAADYVRQEGSYLFTMTPRELSRMRYGPNPFIEAVEVARYLHEKTGEQDRIAVLGSEPEIYFYSGRSSATGYIYMYPLMEPQPYAATMQEEMIREIEAARPKYLVFAMIGMSWLARPQSSRKILEWADRYTQKCFDPVGIADIYSAAETKYVWDDQVPGYHPISPNVIYTFRRRSDAPCSGSP